LSLPPIACSTVFVVHRRRGGVGRHGPHRISQAAFEAIARTLSLGSVSFENATNEKGERLIWLESNVVDRLRYLRGSRESFSDVILRLASEGERMRK
jgi:hypothetical protein